MKLATMLVMVGLSLRVCGESPRTPNVQEAPRTEQVPAGTTNSVGVSAALTTSVSSQPDGTLVAEVRDPAGEPVRAHAITVEIRRPDEDPLPVVMTYDEPQHRYVGHVTGVTAGSYPVQVTVQATPTAQPVEVVAAPITVVAVGGPTAVVQAPTVAVAAPSVEVQRPQVVVQQPAVVVEQPAVAVVGPSITVQTPGVVVAPMLPGVVVVDGDDDDHHHGRHRGRHRGHGHGRGRGRGVFFGVFH